MTSNGLIVCASLLGMLSALNLLGIRWLLSLNPTVTWWKINVPVVTIVVLIASS